MTEEELANELYAAFCSSSADAMECGALRNAVERGLDVFYTPSPQDPPLLHQLVLKGKVHTLDSVLEASTIIDFTTTDTIHRRTVLHCAVHADQDDHISEAMVAALVGHLSRHPRDTVDWEQRDAAGKAFLQYCVENQCLPFLWPILQDVPFFADQDTVLINYYIWEWDLEQVRKTEGEESCFRVEQDHVLKGSRATEILFKSCVLMTSPHHCRVQRCIEDGADVSWVDPRTHQTILHYLLIHRRIDLFMRCLTSPNRIDFSIADSYKWTPLHWIDCNHNEKEVGSLLRSILDRLSTHPDDVIDWGQQDEDGGECICKAAYFGHLGIWLQVMLTERQVPYYVHHDGPIPLLSMKVNSRAWQRLPALHRRMFHVRSDNFDEDSEDSLSCLGE